MSATLVGGVGLAAYAVAVVGLDLEIREAQTMTFVAMSFGQVLSVFNARTESGSGFRGAASNRWLWAALTITFALEAAALGFPPLRDILGLSTLPALGWAIALALGLLPLAAIQGWRAART